jgi:hypothetical protein
MTESEPKPRILIKFKVASLSDDSLTMIRLQCANLMPKALRLCCWIGRIALEEATRRCQAASSGVLTDGEQPDLSEITQWSDKDVADAMIVAGAIRAGTEDSSAVVFLNAVQFIIQVAAANRLRCRKDI